MNILIIEDQKPQAKLLESILKKYDSSFTFLGIIPSIKDSVNFLSSNYKKQNPDLIFVDIELEDGLCFDIFHQIKVPCPLVFTTSYHNLLLEGFKNYMLLEKPITQEKVVSVLEKLGYS